MLQTICSTHKMRLRLRKLCLTCLLTFILAYLWLDYNAEVDYRPIEFRNDNFIQRLMHTINRRGFIRAFKEKYNADRIRKGIFARDQQALTRSVWPGRRLENDDGIIAQLNFQPGYEYPGSYFQSTETRGLKKILVWSMSTRPSEALGQQVFLDEKCPVDSCYLLSSSRDFKEADLVLFHSVSFTRTPRPPGQIWMLSALEAPLRTEDWSEMNGRVNWTASYRHDSTVVTPYEKFVPFTKSSYVTVSQRNYAAGKTKHVAWFVSNCFADNDRMIYAKELSRYIDVDIYGDCGPLKCPRGGDDEKRCFAKLNSDYKFYLSFENANCRDYITEKFFVLGLQHDVLPIVMGASPEDYRRTAPYHSYIHVDEFRSPRELAAFLHLLDSSDALYNSYFAWKGTGEFINTHFWCRVCALLHDRERPHNVYEHIGEWWQGNDVCTESRPW